MHCRLCTVSQSTSVWATSGTRNFRLKTVIDHARSTDHRQSVAATDNQHSIFAGMAMALEKKRAAVTLAMQSCYWVATEEVANAKYKSLIVFLRNRCVETALALHRGDNASHDSTTTFNQLLSCLSGVMEEAMLMRIRNSPFVGIGIDESTDRATEKHLVMIIRYVSLGICKTEFLKCVRVVDGKAATVYDAVKSVAVEYHFDMRKVVGLGSDGASVMASDLNGVNGLMKRDNPHIIFLHRVCHRLNLAQLRPVMSKTIGTLH